MDSRLLWVFVATFVVVIFTDLSDGEEGAEEPGETQGGHGEGSTATVRVIRTTQYQRKRWRPYRLGSLSALSRGLMKTASPLTEKREEGTPRQVREADANGPSFPGAFWDSGVPPQSGQRASGIFPALELRRENRVGDPAT